MEHLNVFAADMGMGYLVARFFFLGVFVVGVWMLSRAVRSLTKGGDKMP